MLHVALTPGRKQRAEHHQDGSLICSEGNLRIERIIKTCEQTFLHVQLLHGTKSLGSFNKEILSGATPLWLA